METAIVLVRPSYRGIFLGALFAASFLPAVISVFNFEIYNQSVYALTAFFSLLLILSGGHVWLTLAYYVDKQWLTHFRTQPLIFFGAPVAILAAMILLIGQPFKPIGLAAVYATTFVNLWHHSKQNWGILAMVGKIRSAPVAAMRAPLIYAWPFFLLPWAMQLPELNQAIGPGMLHTLSMLSVLAYVAFCLHAACKIGLLQLRDPVILLFSFALASYFLPTVLLFGKPYSLAIWATAHALQYYVLVAASLSLRERQQIDFGQWLTRGALVLAILAGLTGVAYFSSQMSSGAGIWTNPTARLILGIVAGVNLIHFWVDAFIWKFSNRDIRQLHGTAFVF